MRRIPLAALALVIGAVACQEVATSPESGATANLTPRYRGNPPPPPIDTGATFSFGAQTFSSLGQSSPWASRFSIRLASALQEPNCEGTPTDVTVPVRYMFDPAGNNGYLHFLSDANTDVQADANGVVKMKDGHFTGKGTVEVLIDGCVLVIDLSTVTDQSSFETCPDSSEFVPEAQDPRPEGGCFTLFFDDGASFDGETFFDAMVRPDPLCDPEESEPPTRCDPFIFNPEIALTG